MKIAFGKSPWEMAGQPLGEFVDRVRADGYDAVEIHLRTRPESPLEIADVLSRAGLPLIAQICTIGATAAEQCRSLEQLYEYALDARPRVVNAQAGVDHFSFDDNVRVLECAERLAAKHGVPILHETHRGRALFSLPAAARFIDALPSLRLTLDVSHWFCVHESDLRDQEPALAAVLDRVDYVHARVGFAEGPQVGDPRNPRYAPWLGRSLEIWTRVARVAASRGQAELTFTPEFGPVPYMPLAGREDRPVADAWEVNRWMRDHLRAILPTD